jgi:hypothetical protein
MARYTIGDDERVVIGQDYQIGNDDSAMQVFSGVDRMSGGDYETVLGAIEILGSPHASQRQKSAAMQRLQVAALAREAGGAVVTEREPKWLYNQILPCSSSATVLASASLDLELKPQRTFRPDFFRASSFHTAPFFTLSAYAIGQENQFVASGNVPIDLFSEVSLNTGMRGQTSNLGNTLTLTVNNISADSHFFRGAFFGKTLLAG